MKIRQQFVMRKLLQLCRLPKQIINKLAPYTFSQIKQAILSNDTTSLNRMLSTAPTLGEDENILMFALNEADEQTILYLIQNYRHLLDFHRRNDYGDSPLMVSIFLKKKDVTRALIPYSNVKEYDFFRNTPFIAAAANGDIQTLQLLLEHPDNNPLSKNNEGQTALHRACYYGEIETIDWLLKKTMLKIGHLDKKRNNGLHLACLGAQITTTRYLIYKVKDPNQLLSPNMDKQTPIQCLRSTLQEFYEDFQNKIDLSHFENYRSSKK